MGERYDNHSAVSVCRLLSTSVETPPLSITYRVNFSFAQKGDVGKHESMLSGESQRISLVAGTAPAASGNEPVTHRLIVALI